MKGSSKKEFHAVILGAMLHDIGRFVQITKDDSTHLKSDQTIYLITFIHGKYLAAFSAQQKLLVREEYSN